MFDSIFQLSAKRVAHLFEAANNAIYRIVQEGRLTDDYGTPASQLKLLLKVHRVLESFVIDAELDFTSTLYDALDFFQSSILEQARAAEYSIPDDIFDDTDKLIKSAVIEFGQYVEMRKKEMLRDVKRTMAKDGILISQRMALAGVNRGEALMGLRPSLMKNAPTLHYIDRSGRRWKGRSYFEMLTHSLLSKFDRDVLIAAAVRMKIDRVHISKIDGDDGCKHWDGIAISLTGVTRGLPTYMDALESGDIFHPRCRHRLLLIGG